MSGIARDPCSTRGRQEARDAAAPRCPHGLLLSAARGGSRTHLECRQCVSATLTVAAFVEAHPGGADLRDVAAVLGVTYQAVQQAEARALRRLAVWAAGDGVGRAEPSSTPDGHRGGREVKTRQRGSSEPGGV